MALFNGTTSSPPTTPVRLFQKGPFMMDREKRQAIYKGKTLDLSPINFDYLWTLLRAAPDPVTDYQLVAESIGFRLAVADPRETTRWRILQLRKAIEIDPTRPTRILTVPGYGYRLKI